jgi:hypothetical protein
MQKSSRWILIVFVASLFLTGCFKSTNSSSPPKKADENPSTKPPEGQPGQPIAKEPGKTTPKEPGQPPRQTDVRKMQPLSGPPVDRGVALQRFSKVMPPDETKKWLVALGRVTGKDNTTLFLQCISTFGSKMGALYDGDKFKQDASAKMLKRLDSLSRDEYRLWLDAFNAVMGQACSDTAVALQLLSMDQLFEGDAYAAVRAKKYLDRMKQLKRAEIDRWCKEVPAFKDGELDAALSITLLEQVYDAEKFNLAAFDRLFAM